MATVGVPVGTGSEASEARRAADEIVARLERLPFSRMHLRMACILGTGTFFDAFDSIAIAVALTVVFTSLHIGFVNAGLLISAGYVGQLVGALLFGALGEMYGRRRTFLLALASFGLFSVVAAFAWSFESLLVIRVIEGFGLGAEIPLAVSLFNEWIRGRTRGRVFILFQNTFPLGLMLTPLIGAALFGLVGRDAGWRVLFAFGGIPLLMAIYGWFKLPESPRWLADKGRIAEADRLVSELESNYPPESLAKPEAHYRADIRPTRFGEPFSPAYLRRTILVSVQFFACYFANYGYTIWLPTLYVQLGHLPPERGLILTAFHNLATIIMNLFLANLFDTVGRKTLFSLGFLFAACGALLGWIMVQLGQTGWQTLFIVSLIMVLGVGVSNIGAYLYAPELYPTRMRAWATAWGSGMSRLSSIIAPVAVGAMLASQLGIGSVFLMFFAVLIVGLVVMVTMGIETKQRVLEEISA
ncbi:MAG TPA: MFS transporter [Chloroflexota bacterium]|nr:MFS transporter [Chloroflexota bacterium]